MSVYNRISNCIRLLETVWDHTRPYKLTWSPLNKQAQRGLYYRQTTCMVSHDRHTTITVQVRIIHSHFLFLFFFCWKFENLWSQAIKKSQFYINFISKHTPMCDNSSITWTKCGGTVCKPCKCPVNQVKVVFYCTRP